jgi:hypothetical protein
MSCPRNVAATKALSRYSQSVAKTPTADAVAIVAAVAPVNR